MKRGQQVVASQCLSSPASALADWGCREWLRRAFWRYGMAS